MKRFLKSREMALLALAVVLMAVIALNNSRFLSASNLMNVLKSNIILLMVSSGMLLVMITGGIDASRGRDHIDHHADRRAFSHRRYSQSVGGVPGGHAGGLHVRRD